MYVFPTTSQQRKICSSCSIHLSLMTQLHKMLLELANLQRKRDLAHHDNFYIVTTFVVVTIYPFIKKSVEHS